MIVRDYFDGYRASAPHPMMTSTGSEGRCDICGRSETRDHERPWTRVAPRFIAAVDPASRACASSEPPPLEPYTGEYRVLIDL